MIGQMFSIMDHSEAIISIQTIRIQHLPVQALGVGRADHLSGPDPPRAVDGDLVVPVEGVLGVRRAVMRHDAAQSVQSPQIHSMLFDLKAVSVELPAGLENLEVTVALDVEVVKDKKTDLLLVDLAVDRCLDPLLEMGVKLSVLLPDLGRPVLEAEGPEDGDAGVHHVYLVEVLHLDPGPGGPGGTALRI